MPNFCAEFPAPGQCRIERFELPQDLKADEVLVRAEVTLVSPGTELAIYTGRHSNLRQANPSWPKFPFTPGYSMVGRVERAGRDVRRVAVGQRVFASAPHASAAVVAEGSVTPVPDGVDPAHAAFAELGAIALNGVRRSRVVLGESVMVVGLGLIGLLATRLARLCGAMPVVASDPSAPRRALAARFGADVVLDPATDDPAAALRGLSDGALADVVIEASGVPRVVVGCLDFVRDQGRVILLGSPHGAAEINFYSHVHRRSLELIGSHMNTSCHPPTPADPWTLQRNHRVVLDLIRRHDLDLSPLVSRRVSPGEMDEVYQSLATDPGGTLGVVVDWSDAAGEGR